MKHGLKLAFLLLCFGGLTVAGVLWVAPPEVGSLLSDAVSVLSPGTIAVLVAFALALIGAEMIRLVAFGRAVGQRVGLKTALDATIANNFFSWLTPGSALGEPASTYMLARGGVPWDAAVLISFAKFATSFAFILAAALLCLGLGFGPRLSSAIVLPLAFAIGLGVFMMWALLFSAFLPQTATAHVARMNSWLGRRRLLSGPRATRALEAIFRAIDGSIERIGRFRRAGAPGWAAMLASHVLYYGLFVAIFVVVADALANPPVTDAAATAVVYQGFLYLAPTPGGSGLGEASADAFFGGLLPGGVALAAVVLFRGLTFYFHVALGLVYLTVLGVIGPIMNRASQKNEKQTE